MTHPFRFGRSAFRADSRQQWIDLARHLEQSGYSTFLMGDHISGGSISPLLALLTAANATSHLRFGTHVLAADFRHPVMLAQEAATFDLMSDGRFELGIGAGWMTTDYTATGIAFNTPGTRVSRLTEVVYLLKHLLSGESVTFKGKHYQVEDMTLDIKQVQRPHLPIHIGGGGKRMLEFAGREANIVGLNPVTTPQGKLDGTSVGPEATERKIAWVQEAAGERFAALELSIIVNRIIVTPDRQRGLNDVANWLDNSFGSIALNYDTTPEAIQQSPHFLVGSVDEIVETIKERRERYGISYYALHVEPEYQTQVDRIVERLAGT